MGVKKNPLHFFSGGQEIHDDDDDDDDDADSVINELPEKWQIIQNALEVRPRFEKNERVFLSKNDKKCLIVGGRDLIHPFRSPAL